MRDALDDKRIPVFFSETLGPLVFLNCEIHSFIAIATASTA
jgi:hypothetical protein